jgi:hypothetical protein
LDFPTLYRVACTLTAGPWSATNPIPREALDERSVLMHFWAFVRMMERMYDASGLDETIVGVSDELDSAANQLEMDAYHYCKQRRIFWTKTGSYGLGPHCMRAGDVVVVLYGGNTPYVLRPSGDKYLFMGQAYVHDIMKGILIQEVKAGRRQEQEFCIV